MLCLAGSQRGRRCQPPLPPPGTAAPPCQQRDGQRQSLYRSAAASPAGLTPHPLLPAAAVPVPGRSRVATASRVASPRLRCQPASRIAFEALWASESRTPVSQTCSSSLLAPSLPPLPAAMRRPLPGSTPQRLRQRLRQRNQFLPSPESFRLAPALRTCAQLGAPPAAEQQLSPWSPQPLTAACPLALYSSVFRQWLRLQLLSLSQLDQLWLRRLPLRLQVAPAGASQPPGHPVVASGGTSTPC